MNYQCKACHLGWAFSFYRIKRRIPIRLLLASCSAAKRHDQAPLAAIERYQGPVYHVIRKNRPSNLAVWILSAEFGLISEISEIPDYERKMNAGRAVELTKEVGQRLDDLLQNEHVTAIFLNMGKVYASALTSSAVLSQLRDRGLVMEAHGGIGLRLQQTKQWLLALAEQDAEAERIQRKCITTLSDDKEP